VSTEHLFQQDIIVIILKAGFHFFKPNSYKAKNKLI